MPRLGYTQNSLCVSIEASLLVPLSSPAIPPLTTEVPWADRHTISFLISMIAKWATWTPHKLLLTFNSPQPSRLDDDDLGIVARTEPRTMKTSVDLSASLYVLALLSPYQAGHGLVVCEGVQQYTCARKTHQLVNLKRTKYSGTSMLIRLGIVWVKPYV
jgi:hypothetical protein